VNQWAEILLTGVVAGLVGSVLTYVFALRKDREERRRERMVAHLIEAYRNLEDASGRGALSDEQKSRLESSIAAIFLLGSTVTASEASRFIADMASASGGDVKPLLKALRNELRSELGLESHDVDIPIFRMSDDGASK
jgi:hypothetical protein